MNFKLPHDVVSACAKRDEPPSQQTMNVKLPHDNFCACAKRDEPPSRRRPSRFLLDQNHLLTTNYSERWPTSARHSISSVYSVDWNEHSCPFVSIRGSLSTLFQELQEIVRHVFHDGVFMADFRYDHEIHLAAVLFQNSLQTSRI